MVLRLAEFNVRYNRTNIVLERKAKDYICQSDNPDFEIELTERDIQEEARREGPEVPKMRVENNLLYETFAERIPPYNAFVMHGATISVDGVGIIFTAPSGTGKTTHMLSWKKNFKDKVQIVNGDKPVIRFFNEDSHIPYAYGMPWCGKENLGCNMRTKLKHICFIERSETNFVTKIEKCDTIDRIMNQVYLPKDPIALANTLKLVDRLINSCELWIIHCNMEPESAKIAYDAIFKNH